MLSLILRDEEVWEGIIQCSSSSECPQIILLNSLIRRQFEVNQVKLSQAAYNLLCALDESHLHHEYDQVSHVLLHTIEHFLDDCDRLMRQKVSLILLLVSEGAAPNEKPAHKDVCLLALYIVFGFKLVKTTQDGSFRQALSGLFFS